MRPLLATGYVAACLGVPLCWLSLGLAAVDGDVSGLLLRGFLRNFVISLLLDGP